MEQRSPLGLVTIRGIFTMPHNQRSMAREVLQQTGLVLTKGRRGKPLGLLSEAVQPFELGQVHLVDPAIGRHVLEDLIPHQLDISGVERG